MAAAAGTLTEELFYRLWFPRQRPKDLEKALEAVGLFYNLGEKPGEKNGPVAYDFLADGAAIYAAFRQEYGLDLGTAKLHWWQFRALLEGLITHSFRERVGYRVGDLRNLPAQQRAEALKYRSLYRLGQAGESLEEHLARLEQAAMRKE